MFASFTVLLGSIVLAIVIGTVTVLVANRIATSTNYQRKRESVVAITSQLQLPEPLRERIHAYYEHLWCEHESIDGELDRFFKDLSHTLTLEVVLCKYMELMIGVPFWANCSSDFHKQIVLSLHTRVYLPDDIIMRRGEISDEFYMINHGTVGLTTGPDSVERAIGENIVTSSPRDADPISNVVVPSQSWGRVLDLRKGQAFGEMALLINYERAAMARAVTHVELCVLSRSSFQRVLVKHPKDRKKVMTAMVSDCMVHNEANAVHCPLKEMVRSVYESGGSDSNRDTVATAEDVLIARMQAADVAQLILSVIDPELDDASIQFGVNTGLRQLLIDKRDRDRRGREAAGNGSATTAGERCSQCWHFGGGDGACGVDQSTTVPTGVSGASLTSPQQIPQPTKLNLPPLLTTDNALAKLTTLETQIRDMHGSHAVLMEMMIDMRAAIHRLQAQADVGTQSLVQGRAHTRTLEATRSQSRAPPSSSWTRERRSLHQSRSNPLLQSKPGSEAIGPAKTDTDNNESRPPQQQRLSASLLVASADNGTTHDPGLETNSTTATDGPAASTISSPITQPTVSLARSPTRQLSFRALFTSTRSSTTAHEHPLDGVRQTAATGRHRFLAKARTSYFGASRLNQGATDSTRPHTRPRQYSQPSTPSYVDADSAVSTRMRAPPVRLSSFALFTSTSSVQRPSQTPITDQLFQPRPQSVLPPANTSTKAIVVVAAEATEDAPVVAVADSAEATTATVSSSSPSSEAAEAALTPSPSRQTTLSQVQHHNHHPTL